LAEAIICAGEPFVAGVEFPTADRRFDRIAAFGIADAQQRGHAFAGPVCHRGVEL
jgi:hypothetical protein